MTVKSPWWMRICQSLCLLGVVYLFFLKTGVMLPSGFSDNSETSITPVWILAEYQRCYLSSLCLVHYCRVLEGSGKARAIWSRQLYGATSKLHSLIDTILWKPRPSGIEERLLQFTAHMVSKQEIICFTVWETIAKPVCHSGAEQCSSWATAVVVSYW